MAADQNGPAALQIATTPIEGLLVAELPLHADHRGWFKENWQREKMVELGLPDFGPVQNNVAFNHAAGTTRGIHAEPWDKWVSVATGRIFGAWVDLREGPGFGTVFSTELDPSRAVFVPRGVGNAYQTLDDGTAYVYLVNDHWSADATYANLNLADETAAIAWPISLAGARISDADRHHPRLADVQPIAPKKVLVVGAAGQLGRALQELVGSSARFEFPALEDFDLTSPDLAEARRWRDYDVIINAAAHTAVDAAETDAGRRSAWQINVNGVAQLARIASEFGLGLVHVSSDYVFDGSHTGAQSEQAPLSPLGVYGQTKAAGDAIVSTVPRHHIIRTSWVIGDGPNFVATMSSLAERGVDPAVVNDQVGRLTFATDLARAILHLIDMRAPYGTYNVTGSGEPMSWADVARAVFELTGHDPHRVTDVTTAHYNAGATGPIAPRPANSLLDLSKIEATGFTPRDARIALAEHLAR